MEQAPPSGDVAVETNEAEPMPAESRDESAVSPDTSSARAGSGSLPDPADLAGPLEAVLLTADRPIQPQRLAEILKLADPADEPGAAPDDAADDESETTPEQGGAVGGKGNKAVAKRRRPLSPRSAPIQALRRAVDFLNAQYEATGRAFRVETVAGGYRVMTLPKYAEAVAAYHGSRARTSLTHAALETLAIIAYRQPITRTQLEAIRGVACGEVLRSLMERRLVTIAGRAEELGRPLLYATTKAFLEVFGLSSLKDLPSVEELRGGGVAAGGGNRADRQE